MANNRRKVKRGFELPQSKLNDSLVRQIRERHANKQAQIEALNRAHSAEAIAKEYRVHVRTIEKVLTYETWRHVV